MFNSFYAAFMIWFVLGKKNKQTLVKVWETSCFGLKYLICSPKKTAGNCHKVCLNISRGVMFRKLIISSCFLLANVETESETAVTGLAAFSPVTPPPSPPPPDVKVKSKTCNVNVTWHFVEMSRWFVGLWHLQTCVISGLQKGLLPTFYPGVRLSRSWGRYLPVKVARCPALFTGISTSELTPALLLHQLKGILQCKSNPWSNTPWHWVRPPREIKFADC